MTLSSSELMRRLFSPTRGPEEAINNREVIVNQKRKAIEPLESEAKKALLNELNIVSDENDENDESEKDSNTNASNEDNAKNIDTAAADDNLEFESSSDDDDEYEECQDGEDIEIVQEVKPQEVMPQEVLPQEENLQGENGKVGKYIIDKSEAAGNRTHHSKIIAKCEEDENFQNFLQASLDLQMPVFTSLVEATKRPVPEVLKAIYYNNGDMALAFEQLIGQRSNENLWSVREDSILLSGNEVDLNCLSEEKGGYIPLIER